MTKNTDKLQFSPEAQNQNEFEIFKILKPYIGNCLKLNHEINNSLAGIIGYSEFLLMDSDKLDEKQKKRIEQIAESAERIRKIVENLSTEKIALSEKVDLLALEDIFKADNGKL